jgi:hypothetical protein
MLFSPHGMMAPFAMLLVRRRESIQQDARRDDLRRIVVGTHPAQQSIEIAPMVDEESRR